MTARQPASMEAAGGGLCHRARQLLDALGGHVGYLGGPRGRVFLHLGCELVEARGALLHEVVVVEVLLDEHVVERQDERQVGARVDGHPVAGEDAGVVEARVNAHDARSGLPGGREALHGRGADAVAVAAADEHDHLRVAEVGGVVRRAHGLHVGALLRQVARRGVRVHVRRSQRMREALGVVLARRAQVLDDGERLGAVLRDDGLHLLADLLEGRIPVDRLELAVVLATQRLRDALVGVRQLGQPVAAAQMRPFE